MENIVFGLAGVFFVFFTITGWELKSNGNILWTAGHTALLLSFSLCIGIVLGISLRFLFLFWEKTGKKSRKKQSKALNIKPVKFWLGSFALLILVRLPFFLAFYPGICAYDMSIQLGQVGDHEYNLHHPLAHTLLLGLSLKLGDLLHNRTLGAAVFIFLQVILLSAACAWAVTTLWKKGLGNIGTVVLQGLFMFYPFFSYMSISVTKDVVFAGLFLLQIISLTQVLREKKFTVQDPVFIAATTLMLLFRNNGIYAMAFFEVAAFLMLLFAKGKRKMAGKLLAEGLAGMILSILIVQIMIHATGALQGDKREMLSVPIQQMARCMLYHGGVGELSEDDGSMVESDRALVNDFLLYESYRSYDEKLSDPVKSCTNTYVVRYRTGEFIRTYLHLLGKYPGDMVNAFLALNAGYVYFGDVSHGRIYELRNTEGLSYVHTRWDPIVEDYGIVRHSFAEGLRSDLKKWADENAYLKIPVLKYFFVPAFFFWGYVVLFLYCFHKKREGMILPLSIVAGYYATLFLGPAVQLRYLFPLIVVFPFLLFLQGTREQSK